MIRSSTIYAEGQRRYVESLSSYARQFLGQMDKPNVESVEGLSPAISIDQKTTGKNPRSTVGTVTEIYDYLRLLYSKIGKAFCPVCGKEIKAQTIDQIVDKVLELESGTKIQILSPIVRGKKGEFTKVFENLGKQGVVLDYLSRGYVTSDMSKFNGKAIAQAIGTERFTLLEIGRAHV